MSNQKALVYSGAIVATVSLITTAVLLKHRLNNRHKEYNSMVNDIDDDAEAFSVSTSRIHAVRKDTNAQNSTASTSTDKGVATAKQTNVVTQNYRSARDEDSKQNVSVKGQTPSASINR